MNFKHLENLKVVGPTWSDLEKCVIAFTTCATDTSGEVVSFSDDHGATSTIAFQHSCGNAFNIMQKMDMQAYSVYYK